MDILLRSAPALSGALPLAVAGYAQEGLRELTSLFEVLILVALTALFVAAEYSLVKARPTRLDELASNGSYGAKLARQAANRLDFYLSATQVGVTITTLVLGRVGEPAVDRLLSPLFHRLPLSDSVEGRISLFLSIALMAALQVIFGEQIPKYLSIQRAERIAVALSPFLNLWGRLMYVPVWLLAATVGLVLRVAGVPAGHEGEAHTPEEIGMIVTSSEERGTVGADEAEIARNAIIIGDRDARDIMVPRVDMAYLTTAVDLKANIQRANDAGFTRFPLCSPDTDHVIGMVHIKDLLSIAVRADATIEDAKRDILVVPETKPLDSLLREFQSSRIHMALVLDEYGGTAGIVTLEDVLEEIVGDIQDEHQHEHPEVQRVGDNALLVDGGVTLEDLADDHGIELDTEEAETVGGYVQWRLGAVPETGQQIHADGYHLKVEAMEGRRVRTILISPAPHGVETPAA